VKLLAFLCMLALVAMSTADSPRERKLLDFGWRFHLGNAADMTKDFGFGGGQTFAKAGSGPGPIQPGFDDTAWRSINVPHDWVVEEDFVHNDDGLMCSTAQSQPVVCFRITRLAGIVARFKFLLAIKASDFLSSSMASFATVSSG